MVSSEGTPGTLLGRRVGFLLLEPMVHRRATVHSLASLPSSLAAPRGNPRQLICSGQELINFAAAGAVSQSCREDLTFLLFCPYSLARDQQGKVEGVLAPGIHQGVALRRLGEAAKL
jgi:hypothetical protein